MWNPYVELPSKTRRILGISSVATVLLAWSLISGLDLVPSRQLPAPWEVFQAFLRQTYNFETGASPLLEATVYSTARVLIAGVFVCVIGIPIGVMMGASPHINAALSPLVDPFRSAPIVAVLPILVVWLGIGELMKVAFLFFGAVVYLIPMTRDAVQAVPSTYWISARDLGATPWESVRKSVLPIAMPRIADAIIVSVSIMWTYITVAEYVNAESGLGHLIQTAKRLSAMDRVFVGIMVIIALALVSYLSMVALKRWMFPWESQ